MKHLIKKENSGFTLVELIITMAVLAVISVPLLKYFSDSMRHNVRMKEEQNAVVAAQNVLEELKVIDTSLDDIATLTAPSASGPALSVSWSQLSAPASNPDGSYSYEVKGNYALNKSSYAVKAKITPRKSLTNDDGDTKTYQRAEVPSMDSAKDVIATEQNHYLSNAVLHFYGLYTKKCEVDGVTKDPAINSAYITQRMKRKIKVNIVPSTSLTDKFDVTVSYSYYWRSQASDPSPYIRGVNAASEYSETVQDATLDKTGAHNIFVFYKPINYLKNPTDTSVTVVTDEIELSGDLSTLGVAAGLADNKLNLGLYLVADDTVDRTHCDDSASYKLTVDKAAGTSVDSYISDVFTNLKSAEATMGSVTINGSTFPSASGYGFHYENLVKQFTTNRVADIEVSVYKDTGGAMDEKDKFTTVNGTKVQ